MNAQAPAIPTRRLFDPNPETRLKYVPAVETNIAETFARFRRLQSMQRASQEQRK